MMTHSVRTGRNGVTAYYCCKKGRVLAGCGSCHLIHLFTCSLSPLMLESNKSRSSIYKIHHKTPTILNPLHLGSTTSSPTWYTTTAPAANQIERTIIMTDRDSRARAVPRADDAIPWHGSGSCHEYSFFDIFLHGAQRVSLQADDVILILDLSSMVRHPDRDGSPSPRIRAKPRWSANPVGPQARQKMHPEQSLETRDGVCATSRPGRPPPPSCARRDETWTTSTRHFPSLSPASNVS